MDKKEFVAQELRKRGLTPSFESSRPDWSTVFDEEIYSNVSVSAEELFGNEEMFGEVIDESVGESADEKPSKKPQNYTSPQRLEHVRRYMKLYLRYMRPAKPLKQRDEQYLLDDLTEYMRKLCTSWATATASKRIGYISGDEEDGMQLGCLAVYNAYMTDKANNLLRRYPVAYFQRIFRNKAIDYFRHIYGTVPKSASKDPEKQSAQSLKQKYPDISIDALLDEESGKTADRLLFMSENPFKGKEKASIRTDLCNRILLHYYRELMDYAFEPQKPIIVMYGRVLFQLCKHLDPEAELLHPDSWDAASQPGLIERAKKSTRLSSTNWAYEKMGHQNLRALGQESQQIMQRHVDPKLRWGQHFLNQLPQTAVYNISYEEDGRIVERSQSWGDLVFTRTFPDQKKANHWITDINKSTIEKAARKLQKEADLSDYILEEMYPDNLMRIALAKQMKEVEK